MISTADYNSFKQANPNLEPDARDFANLAGTGPDIINSSTLAPTPSLNLATSPVDSTDYASKVAGIPDYNQIISGIFAPTQAENDTTQSRSAVQSLMERIRGLGGNASSTGQIDTSLAGRLKNEEYLKSFGYTGSADALRQFQDVTSRISTLKKEALAIPIRLQQEAQGRGVTAGGLQPIQTAQLRNNAIESLTASSIAESIQGNIQTASALAKDAVDMEFAPLQAELNAKLFNYQMNKDALERADKKKTQALEVTLNERARLLEEQKTEKRAITEIGMKLAQFGVDTATIDDVIKSRNVNEAISKAGAKLQDPKQIAELENLKLEQTLTKQKIRREAYELKLLQEYGGLTPTQYAEKLKEEQKAIKEAKDEDEKNRLQAQALDEKATLLESILSSNAIDSVVGPTPLTRATGGVGGLLLRTVVGGPLQGLKDQLTGSADLLIANTEKFLSQEFLDNLISVKAKGATFGALTDKEGQALRDAADAISNRKVYSDKQKTEVSGYNMAEKDFIKNFQTILELTKKAKEKALGESFDTGEQNDLDKIFNEQFNPNSYFQ